MICSRDGKLLAFDGSLARLIIYGGIAHSAVHLVSDRMASLSLEEIADQHGLFLHWWTTGRC